MSLEMDPQLKFVHCTVKMLRGTAGTIAIFCFFLTTAIFIAVNGDRNMEELRAQQYRSKQVLKYMNFSADPCNDFYEFACGLWNEVEQRDDDDEVITPDYLLEEEITDKLQNLIRNPQPGPNAVSENKIRHFYDSCIGESAKSDKQHDFYIAFIRKHGGLSGLVNTNWDPDYNWESVVANLRANYGMNILIGLKIAPSQEPKGSAVNSIYIGEPELTLLPEELCSAEAALKDEELEELYGDYEGVVARRLNNWLDWSKTETERVAADIVSFEFKLCKQIRADQLIQDSGEEEEEEELESRFATKTHQKIRNQVGQARLNRKQRGEYNQYQHLHLQDLTRKFGQQINFVTYVNTILSTHYTEKVYLHSEAYFSNLAQLINETTKPTLANYIMYNALSAISFPEDDSPKNRPTYCTNLLMNYFPQHLGEMYYRRYYREDINEDIERIYEDIDNAFEESLNVEWMSSSYKRAAKQKLAQFHVRIPTYENLDLRDLSIESLRYWPKLERIMKYNAEQELRNFAHRRSDRVIEAYEVDLRLEESSNELQIGLGLLQPPFYHRHFYGNSLKYSLLGQALARTLVFVFDERGWNKDPERPMHWDAYTTEGYRNVSQCFRTQFSNYLYNNPDELRNAFKLREFIADSSGLNIAFRAYLLWLKNTYVKNQALKKETLPDVNFTNTQLFFINFAQLSCATTVKKNEERIFPMDWHTEERFAVNGPLSNFDEFAREFNCAPGSQMNLHDKCVLF